MHMGFSNVVRFLVKEGSQKDFEDVFDTFAINDGENAGYLIKTGESEYVYVGIWDSEDALAASRDKMISDLDKMRGFPEETSTGSTDPRSGHIVWSR